MLSPNPVWKIRQGSHILTRLSKTEIAFSKDHVFCYIPVRAQQKSAMIAFNKNDFDFQMLSIVISPLFTF